MFGKTDSSILRLSQDLENKERNLLCERRFKRKVAPLMAAATAAMKRVIVQLNMGAESGFSGTPVHNRQDEDLTRVRDLVDLVLTRAIKSLAGSIFGHRKVRGGKRKRDDADLDGLEPEKEKKRNTERYMTNPFSIHMEILEGKSSGEPFIGSTAELKAHWVREATPAKKLAPFPEGKGKLKDLIEIKTPLTVPRLWGLKYKKSGLRKLIDKSLKDSNKSSAPGMEGVGYWLFCLCPLIAEYWELLYLTLHRLDLPKHWLDCDMIFLAKKVAQTTDPSAVRPIMLFDTAYKVYMGVVSELLEQQLAQSNWWGPGQKARKGTDGTLEAGNLLDAVINRARRENTRLYILWIDIKNAFGSLEHDLIDYVLKCMNIDPFLVWMITSTYKKIILNNRMCGKFESLRGTGQGGRLSMTLFEVIFEVLLKWLERDSPGALAAPKVTVKTIAYADDACMPVNEAKAMRRICNIVSTFGDWAGLSFGIGKGKSEIGAVRFSQESGKGRKRVCVLKTVFKLQGQTIPHIDKTEGYKHLGTWRSLILAHGSNNGKSREKAEELHQGNLEKIEKFHHIHMAIKLRIVRELAPGKLSFVNQRVDGGMTALRK